MASFSALAICAVFHNMLTHINCPFFMTLEQWQNIFGEVTEEHAYGRNFWQGFRNYMRSVYRPQMRRHRYLGDISPTEAWFQLPHVFSKARAREPQDPVRNPGTGHFYPCWCWFQDASRSSAWIICINICLKLSSAWSVHSSWITILASPIPTLQAEPPSYTTTTSVVIEECEDED